MPALIYGIILLGAIVFAFFLYALIMTGCFTTPLLRQSQPDQTMPPARDKTLNLLNLKPYSASTFRYKKGILGEDAEASIQTECAVCLSGFEDEECVRRLPYCRHSFHASCIDMWLYSHNICPLCRTPINRLESSGQDHASSSTIDEHSTVSLVHISTS